MINYIKWFKNIGWKQYLLAFTFSIAFTVLYFNHLDEIFNSPLAISILITISKFGFDIGIVSHSIITYRANK